MIGLAERTQVMLGTAVLALAVAGTTVCSGAAGDGNAETPETASLVTQASHEVLVYKAPT